MQPRIVVIGASAGGVKALCALVASLPADLDAAVYIVLHVPAHSPSHLAEILAQRTTLPVTSAVDGDPIRPGAIVVAQEGCHLMIESDHIRLTRAPLESRARPSIDVMFRSAAAAHGQRVIGIVLTGLLDDGTAGLWAVKDRGGQAWVQDPQSAEFADMPLSALRSVEIDRVMELEAMAGELVRCQQEDAAVHDAEQSMAAVAGRLSVDVLGRRSRLATGHRLAEAAGGRGSPSPNVVSVLVSLIGPSLTRTLVRADLPAASRGSSAGRGR